MSQVSYVTALLPLLLLPWINEVNPHVLQLEISGGRMSFEAHISSSLHGVVVAPVGLVARRGYTRR